MRIQKWGADTAMGQMFRGCGGFTFIDLLLPTTPQVRNPYKDKNIYVSPGKCQAPVTVIECGIWQGTQQTLFVELGEK